MNIYKVKKPAATDTKTIRSLLKEAGIKINVRKMNWLVLIGKQCERLSKDTASQIVSLMEAHGYIIDIKDITLESIENGVCDTILVQIPA